MNSKEFAEIIVEEVVDKNPPDSRLFLCENGINFSNLDKPNEIWKAFVRYNIDAGGIKSSIVGKYWNQLPNNALLKQRERLIDKILPLKNLECYKNFTYNCPVKYKARKFVDSDKCHKPLFFNQCPVVNLIQELSWHKKHYPFAKIIVEDAKRLLIEDSHGKLDENLNDVVNGVLKRYSCDDQGKSATDELLSKFENIKGYGTPSKVITWFFSEFSSPIHQINHWPELYYRKLNPVDTHVRRLMIRFGFIDSKEASNEKIDTKLNELYPEEPRKLDFALYRLGGEESICAKTPNCTLCKEKHPIIWENCPIPSLKFISEYFNQYFTNWKITLHEEDLKNRKNGYIKERGWLIQYCFGENENGKYLDFYASHRMTDDRHHRIYADGKVEYLPALWQGYAYSPDDPEDKKRQKEKFEQHNEKVVKMMIEKGFTQFTINMYLQAGFNENI